MIAVRFRRSFIPAGLTVALLGVGLLAGPSARSADAPGPASLPVPPASLPVPIVTTHFPPYVVAPVEDTPQEAQMVSGLATDVVREACRRADLPCTITALPWARAYEVARTQHNVMIFAIARTPEREEQFHWLGVVSPYKVNLYRLRERTEIPVVADPALLKPWVVGGQNKDIKALWLADHGFQVQWAASAELTVRMLFGRRVDLVAGDSLSFPLRVAAMGYTPTDLVAAAPLPAVSAPLYLAAHPNGDRDRQNRLRDALKAMHEDGTWTTVWSRLM